MQRLTVRVSVPSHYRRLYKDLQKDCVKDVLADLACHTGVRSHQLTGGRWERQDFGKRGHNLLGWLRLPEASARALIRKSGARGIFVTEQTSDGTPVEHTWVARHDKESDEDYKARAELLASQRSQGIVCRKGGASDLGFIAVDTDRAPDKPVLLELSGLPVEWQEEELTELLSLEGWTQVSTVSRRKRKGCFNWMVRAKPPFASSAQKAWTYRVEDSTGLSSFDVVLNLAAPRRTPQPVERVYVQGPKKSWSSERGNDPKRASGSNPASTGKTAESSDAEVKPSDPSHGPFREKPPRAQPYPAKTQLDPPSASQGGEIEPTPEESEMAVAEHSDGREPQMLLECRLGAGRCWRRWRLRL